MSRREKRHTDIRCVDMCRIQLRLNGLDGFGKMAGRLGLMLGAWL